MNYRKIMEAEPDQETLKRHLYLLFGTTNLDEINDTDLRTYWKMIRPKLLEKEGGTQET